LTGEGANVYGAGHYVAERKGIAQSYYEQMAQQEHFVGNEPLDINKPEHIAAQYLDMHDNAKDAIDNIKRDIEYAEIANPDIPPDQRVFNPEPMRAAIEHINSGKPVEPMSTKLIGNLYQVRVKADPRRMLHWDKMLLAEQTSEVRAALDSLPGLSYGQSQRTRRGDFTQLSVRIERRLVILEKADSASEMLRDAGLHGIQYYDASSRAEGPDRTHNLVIFHDEHLEITHVNGVPVPKAVAESPAGMKVRVGVSEEAAKERRALWLDPLFRPEGEQNAIKLTAPEYKAYSDRLEKLQAAIELKAEKAAEARSRAATQAGVESRTGKDQGRGRVRAPSPGRHRGRCLLPRRNHLRREGSKGITV
jgi:hypothetical protein